MPDAAGAPELDHDARMSRALLASALVALLVAADAASAVTPRRVPSAGMTIAVPSTWKAVDAVAAASAAGAALRKENPQLAAILDQLSRPGSVIKLFAFDPAGAERFATNVNVVVTTLPAGVTFAQYLASARSELSLLPQRVGPASSRAVELPAGRAVRSQVKLGVIVDGRRILTAITQWAFLRPGKSVVVTFTTIPARSARYRPVFATAARSIRFG